MADTRTYNGFGELASHTTTWNGAEKLKREYLGRDALGRITQLRETVNGGTPHTTDYRYDAAGRLWQVDVDGVQVAEYTYDANGNRLTAPGLGGTPVYDDQDRLLAYDGATYTYTASGQLASKTVGGTTTTYEYDALGSLRGVTWPGTTIEYVVDGQQRRVGKRVNGALVQGFLWEDQLRLAAELDGSGTVVARFVYGTGVNVPEYVETASGTYRLLTDHLGSVRQVIDVATGSVVQALTYDAWGRVLSDTNPGFQPFGFAGGLYDPDTGLVRFGARDYDAAVGVWTALDPLSFGGGDTNLRTYALGDPLTFVDPEGLSASSCCANDGDDFLNCLDACLRRNDPLNLLGKALLTLEGGTFWKAWAGLPSRLFGSSPLTTVPSALGHAAGGGPVAGGVRTIGRIYSPLWIAYGDLLFAVDAGIGPS